MCLPSAGVVHSQRQLFGDGLNIAVVTDHHKVVDTRPDRRREVYRIKEEARAQLERVESALTLAVKRAGGLVPVGKAHSFC